MGREGGYFGMIASYIHNLSLWMKRGRKEGSYRRGRRELQLSFLLSRLESGVKEGKREQKKNKHLRRERGEPSLRLRREKKTF